MTAGSDKPDQQAFLLSQYLDGQLDLAARQQLERQLADDPELAALLDDFSRTDRLIRANLDPAPELDWERFADEAARRRETFDALTRRRRLLRLFAPLSAAAAIVLLASLYHLVVRPSPTDRGPQPLAVIKVQKADAWREAPGLGPAYADVSVVRAPALQITETTTTRRVAVATAAAAAVVVRTRTTEEQPAPFF